MCVKCRNIRLFLTRYEQVKKITKCTRNYVGVTLSFIIMLTYSRNCLMSLHSWWKVSSQLQISRHVCQAQQVKRPLSTEVWSTLKSIGLLRKHRVRRGRPSTHEIHRIKPVISVDRIYPCRNSRKTQFTGVETNTLNIQSSRSSNKGAISSKSNLIVIKRLPFPTAPILAKPVDFTLLNARSVRNKAHVIKDFVVDRNIDLLAITEILVILTSKSSMNYALLVIILDMYRANLVVVELAYYSKNVSR